MTNNKKSNGANLGFENKLWEMADKMRGHMDSGEYKHVALDLISNTYHEWRNTGGKYEDRPGWWKSATLDEIKSHGYVLTPGRYVGAEEIENDGVPFEEKMSELSATLYQQFDKADQLEVVIRKNLEVLGYGK